MALNNTPVQSWMSTTDNITPLGNIDYGHINEGYEIMKDENTNEEKSQ